MQFRSTINFVLICFFLTGLMAMGCSGYVPKSAPLSPSADTIYQVSEQEALDLVYWAMHEVLPEQKIHTLAKPRVGLFVHEQSRPGDVRYARFKERTYIYEVDIFRVEGIDPLGNRISGYTCKTGGSGDLKDGPGNLEKLDQKIKETFDQTERGKMVTAVSKPEAAPPVITTPPPPAPVKAIEAPASHAPAPVQQGAPSGEDAFEKLEKLKKLLDKGIITQEEFDAKKRELLERI